MKIIGMTEDNRPVVSEVFQYYDTHGIDFLNLFEIIDARDYQISWTHFLDEAFDSGWNFYTLHSKIEHPFIDVFGRTEWENYKLMISFYVKTKDNN